MAGYNWQKIFKAKTEKELIQIYSGESSLNFEAEIYAGLELKNRNFDFQTIDRIHQQKIIQLERDIDECKFLNYTNSKYFRNQLLALIGIFFIIFNLVNREIQNQLDSGIYYRYLFYIIILLINILIAKLLFERFKRKKHQTIDEKTKLLKMMKDD